MARFYFRKPTAFITGTTLIVIVTLVGLVGYNAGRSNSSKVISADTNNSLKNQQKKDIAMQLVSAAENSSLDWKAQYGYIEYNVEGNPGDNRGYTGGIIGFTSATGDMLEVVKYYSQISPDNQLQKYLPALERVNGTPDSAGLGESFMTDWKNSARNDSKFQDAQNHERDRLYFNPAVNQAITDGLQALGQFMYYDAAIMHGTDSPDGGLMAIRASAIAHANTPTQGGDEMRYLEAFLDARKVEMRKEQSHTDTTRIDTAQRKFLHDGNLRLKTPLTFSVYSDRYMIK